jgi:hypothetical protein
MSPIREAIGLPVLFLTIALSGGFRLTGQVRLVAPSLTALILAVLFLGVLIRAGGISTSALLHGDRTAAENMSGAVVLATLFAATSQALNLLIPDVGLLHAVFAIFIFCQLLTISAARTDRAGSLRSIVVLFGSLFVLRFILVEALYSSSGSTLNRVLRTLLSGATLGGITYEPNAPATGYVAFFTLALYLVGLLLLPKAAALPPVPRQSDLTAAITRSPVLVLLAALAFSTGCRKAEPPAGTSQPTSAAPELVTPEQREAALRSARVWREPAIPIAKANLRINPAGAGSFKAVDQGHGRDNAEVRLRTAGQRHHSREVRARQPGVARRNRRHATARYSGFRGGPDVRRQTGPLRGLPRLPFSRAQVLRRDRHADAVFCRWGRLLDDHRLRLRLG